MTFTKKVSFYLITFLTSNLINAIPVDENNEILEGDTIDLSRFGDAIFGDPSDDVGRMVSEWKMESGQNPEELGTYVEGDILIPMDEARNGLVKESSRWKNKIVPYVIHSSVSGSDRQTIMNAIGIYEKQTCLRFVKRTSERDYISIESSNSGCWSSVGRIGGKQVVNLQSKGCLSRIGTVLHELAHAIGFYHEQNRPDRDNFVKVMTQNIKPETLPNFEKARPGETVDYGVRYDYDSVMHYSSVAFSRNGAKTIVALSGSDSRMGQRDGFSRGDLQKINSMYQCDGVVDSNGANPGSSGGSNNNGFNQMAGSFLSGLGSFFHALGGGRHDENDNDIYNFKVEP